MKEPQLFILADQSLTKIVDQIKDDQWDLIVPEDINAEDMTLRQLLNYHAYDEAWVPDTLAGKTIEEVGTKYDGDLLGEDPKANWHKIVDKTIDFVKSFDDLEKKVHLTYGEYPAREYLWHITSFRTFRTVDLARFLKVDDKLPDNLVKGMWDILEIHAEEWRELGIFGPKVEVPDNANLYSRLLGLVGRQP